MAFRAIDPGTKMGWASWSQDGVRSGVFDLKGKSEGATYTRCREALRDFFCPGDVIGLEAAIMPAGGAGGFRSRLPTFGIRAIVLMVAYERSARVIEVHSAEWRSHTHGVTQAPRHLEKKLRRPFLKARAIEFVRAKGWGQVTEDAAEALCILDFVRSQHDVTYLHRQPMML